MIWLADTLSDILLWEFNSIFHIRTISYTLHLLLIKLKWLVAFYLRNLEVKQRNWLHKVRLVTNSKVPFSWVPERIVIRSFWLFKFQSISIGQVSITRGINFYCIDLTISLKQTFERSNDVGFKHAASLVSVGSVSWECINEIWIHFHFDSVWLYWSFK